MLNDYYDVSANLQSQSCEVVNEKWLSVAEGGNIYGALTASGGGYLCNYVSFSDQSDSVIDINFLQLFKNASLFDYRLTDNSSAINFGNKTKQPSDSLGDVDELGFLQISGILRDEAHHSAGAYEYQNLFRSDVNGSSEITTTDALLTLRNSLGLSMTGTAWQSSITTGDVNCDGNSNSTDALLLLRYSLGLDMDETAWCEVM